MGWISVKERLPKGKKVIWYHPEIKTDRFTMSEYIRIDVCDLPNRPATHWMPLPEPPQADQPTQKSCEGCEHLQQNLSIGAPFCTKSCEDFSNYKSKEK